MALVIPAPTPALLPVEGTADSFPVRRVYCVGRNYAAHAREMGHDPDREPPFFFAKPADAIVPGGTLPYPLATRNLHHEIELVAALGSGGTDIPVERALDCVWGYAVGLDMTRRDLQDEAKKMARPWAMAKGFDQSGPCSPLRPVSAVGHPQRARIWLEVNGTIRQDSTTDHMIWSLAETVAYLSRFMALQAGDLIFTGTPEGVAAVGPGDTLRGGVDGIGTLTVTYR